MARWKSTGRTHVPAVWKVRLAGNDWRGATYSCPFFTKKRVCKHSIDVALRLKVPGCQSSVNRTVKFFE